MKVGNACGFWGDDIDAPRAMLEQVPELDYLTLDYLSEVSLSIMAVQKEKDPELGYARDFLHVVESLVPYWKKGGKCKLITNGGGLNPMGLAMACKKIYSDLKIGVITGDDALPVILEDPSNPLYCHLETKEPFKEATTANAYLGAKPVAVALDLGADVVIGGRIADPSLTVGPCLHHFRWAHDAYDRIAGATIAGHLIECGTQVTGGISTHWLQIPHVENIGYPIAEIFEDGSCIITKPPHTGGAVTIRTVKEQLLYEIGNPGCYKSPDVVVSFLHLKVEQVEKNRVKVSGAYGSAPPFTLKVSATARAGFKAEGTLAIYADRKAAIRAGEAVFKKISLEKTLIETFGSKKEWILRLSARDSRREAIETFTKKIAPLVTAGPQGTTGYISGRAEVRPVFRFWPCLIEAAKLKVNIDII